MEEASQTPAPTPAPTPLKEGWVQFTGWHTEEQRQTGMMPIQIVVQMTHVVSLESHPDTELARVSTVMDAWVSEQSLPALMQAMGLTAPPAPEHQATTRRHP